MPEEKDYILVAGALIGFLGVIAMIAPFITGIALSISLGILLILSGVIQTAHVFSVHSWRSGIVQAIIALVYVIGGISLLANPTLGLTTLTVLLFFYLIIQGAAEIVLGLRLRNEEYAFGIILSGLLSLLLAGLIWTGWPTSASWAIGLLFGASLLSTGLSMVFYGVSLRENGES